MDSLETADLIYWIITGVAMLLMGLLLLKKQVYMVIIVTSIIGAYLMVRGVSLLVGDFPP